MRVCSSCSAEVFKSFLDFGRQPRTGIYLEKRDGARVASTRIALEYCVSCGFIRQVENNGGGIDYAEVERGTAQQLPHYAVELIEGLRTEGISSSSLIVEVGCNDGSFLEVLRSSGFTNLVGIEPSLALSQTAAERGFRTETVPLTLGTAKVIAERYGQADAVICRHTLEHVPEPGELIAAIREVLKPNGICVIEVPDTDWIIGHLHVHEVWDEHVSYFRPSSLNLLLERQGLGVRRMEAVRFRDTQNLICFATKGPADGNSACASDGTTMADIANCASRWANLVAELHREIDKSPQPIIAIGASHIQLNFLTFAGLQDRVSLLIDDDVRKTGRFAPIGAGIPIISTNDAINQIGQGTLLRTAFPYPKWMDTLCAALSPKGVVAIAPYELNTAPNDHGGDN